MALIKRNWRTSVASTSSFEQGCFLRPQAAFFEQRPVKTLLLRIEVKNEWSKHDSGRQQPIGTSHRTTCIHFPPYEAEAWLTRSSLEVLTPCHAFILWQQSLFVSDLWSQLQTQTMCCNRRQALSCLHSHCPHGSCPM